MEHVVPPILPIFLLVVCVIGLALGLLVFARVVRPGRPGCVTRMPYESGMDPIHDTRRRFDVRFYLLAIAFLVFDVELLFLYPWAVAAGGTQGIREGARGLCTSVPVKVPINGSAEQLAMEKSKEGETGRSGDQPAAKGTVPFSLTRKLGQSSLRSSAAAEDRHLVFAGVMTFVALLTLGFVYDWRKGVFRWR